MRNCFVPMCDQKNRDPQRGMFSAPKELFEAWLEVLPKSRPFKRTDKVCELHFRPGEILKTFDQTINGKLIQFERDRPKLKPNVIPSQNLPDKNSSVPLAKRGRIPNSLKSSNHNVAITPSIAKKSKIVVENNYAEPFQEELQDDPESDGNDVESMIEEVLIQYIPNEETANEVPQILNIEKLDNVEVSENMPASYESLYDEVFEIILPSTLWGVHRCPDKKFIAFTYMDPHLLKTTKSIYIDNKNNMRVQMANTIIDESILTNETCCTEYLTDIISDVDLIKMCLKAYFEDSCDIKATEDSDYCFNCSNGS